MAQILEGIYERLGTGLKIRVVEQPLRDARDCHAHSDWRGVSPAAAEEDILLPELAVRTALGPVHPIPDVLTKGEAV